ncbi:NB-ARC domain-containing protein [Lyngbya confervoides]|uniref:NB-ARC domain-containing protein n=1 Tax=Lyngbya confervoides BDU141951 TaxID=1574623 RepID=A0ABD4SZ67_9CYAN|nr:NB-ARC domain-containing protein [Lyngbya confervoides]MCM1981635.1 NB-ARC domain-containing protein [Lyngbya confervoides BDU141951]
MKQDPTWQKLIEQYYGLNLDFKLTDLQWYILYGSNLGETYQQLALQSGYDYDHIKHVAADLWRSLSFAIGEPVSKRNFRSVLKRYQLTQVSQTNLKSAIPEAVAKLSNPAPVQIEAQEIRWVGRQFQIERLSQKILADCWILYLVGMSGIGKSALAARLVLEPAIIERFHRIYFVRCSDSQDSFEELAAQVLGESIQKSRDLRQNVSDMVTLLVKHLQQHPVLIILDTLEDILVAAKNGVFKFQDPSLEEFFSQYLAATAMASRFIVTSQVYPPVLEQGKYITRTYQESLQGLSLDESLHLFSLWEIMPQSDLEQEYLLRYCQAYEGHPLALRVIAGEIADAPFRNNITAYWNEYGKEIEALEFAKNQSMEQPKFDDNLNLQGYSLNLTDLVEQRMEKTFERIRQQHPLAYQLLCMGSVYRGATPKEGWLIMICAANPIEQNLAFQSLQRRFLLEADVQNSRLVYRLHNLLRSVALRHLKYLDRVLLI